MFKCICIGIFIFTATTAIIYAACSQRIWTKDHESLAACATACTNCCAYTAYTPVCTFCGIAGSTSACYQNESYQSVTQAYSGGNCSGGQCSSGYPDGDPGSKTCYYCSESGCG